MQTHKSLFIQRCFWYDACIDVLVLSNCVVSLLFKFVNAPAYAWAGWDGTMVVYLWQGALSSADVSCRLVGLLVMVALHTGYWRVWVVLLLKIHNTLTWLCSHITEWPAVYVYSDPFSVRILACWCEDATQIEPVIHWCYTSVHTDVRTPSHNPISRLHEPLTKTSKSTSFVVFVRIESELCTLCSQLCTNKQTWPQKREHRSRCSYAHWLNCFLWDIIKSLCYVGANSSKNFAWKGTSIYHFLEDSSLATQSLALNKMTAIGTNRGTSCISRLYVH